MITTINISCFKFYYLLGIYFYFFFMSRNCAKFSLKIIYIGSFRSYIYIVISSPNVGSSFLLFQSLYFYLFFLPYQNDQNLRCNVQHVWDTGKLYLASGSKKKFLVSSLIVININRLCFQIHFSSRVGSLCLLAQSGLPPGFVSKIYWNATMSFM